jgi:hypothetical protein
MAVLKRDIDREKARLAKMEKSKLPDSAPIETIVLSSDDEDDILAIRHDSSIGGRVDANGVIHIDSDSEADTKNAPTLPQRRSAPRGISLSALRASPPGGVVVDLTAMVDEPLASPSTHGQDALSRSPKKRGSVSLRLDLSTEALRGVSFTDAQPPSPVTLAPRTARPLSAHPSLASGVDHFFPDPANTDPSLLPHLLTTIATQSQAQNDIIGGSAGPGTDSHMLDLPVQSAPSSTHIDSMMSLGGIEGSHQMDLDLFGEIVDDDSEGAMTQGGNTQDLQQLLSQPPETAGLNISLNMDASMSQVPTEVMSADASQQAQQPAPSAEFPVDSFTTNNSTISEPSQPNSLPTELSNQPEQPPEEQQQQQQASAQLANDVPANNSDELMEQISQSGALEAGVEHAVEGAESSSAPQPSNDASAMSLESLQTNMSNADMTFSELDLPGLSDVAGMNLDDITLDFPDFLGDTGDGSSLMDLTNFGEMDITAILNSFDNPNPSELQ